MTNNHRGVITPHAKRDVARIDEMNVQMPPSVREKTKRTASVSAAGKPLCRSWDDPSPRDYIVVRGGCRCESGRSCAVGRPSVKLMFPQSGSR